MEAKEIKEYLAEQIEKYQTEVYALSDDMWEHPELGLEEFRASGKMQEILKKHGFQVKSGIGGMPTAFVAEYGSGQPVMGLNLEFDCLPGLSQKKDAVVPDPVHVGAPGQGCGHNVLGPAALLAGLAYKDAMEKLTLPGTIKLFGCPYEESSVGKPAMGKAGAFEHLDFVLDWHPWNYSSADYDTCNCVVILEFYFKGKTCHGAMPWEGRSALDGGMLFGHALEMLREHLIPGNPAAAHTINYNFPNTGPEYPNVVPDTTTVRLYARFNDVDVAKDARRRIELCAKGAALATETEVTSRLITFTHTKIPNQTLSRVVYENLLALGVPEYTQEEQDTVAAMQKAAGLPPVGLDTGIQEFKFSEGIITDASEFSWNAPYATFNIVLGPRGGWHNWMVTACAGSTIGKKCLSRAAEVLSFSAADLWQQPETLKKAKEEWIQQMGERTYESLLPDDYEPPLGMNRKIMEQYADK